MKQNVRNRAAVRSARLKQEASNCITIAVGKTGGFTADLIDEAVRLNARARELSAPTDDRAKHRQTANAA